MVPIAIAIHQRLIIFEGICIKYIIINVIITPIIRAITVIMLAQKFIRNRNKTIQTIIISCVKIFLRVDIA